MNSDGLDECLRYVRYFVTDGTISEQDESVLESIMMMLDKTTLSRLNDYDLNLATQLITWRRLPGNWLSGDVIRTGLDSGRVLQKDIDFIQTLYSINTSVNFTVKHILLFLAYTRITPFRSLRILSI